MRFWDTRSRVELRKDILRRVAVISTSGPRVPYQGALHCGSQSIHTAGHGDCAQSSLVSPPQCLDRDERSANLSP